MDYLCGIEGIPVIIRFKTYLLHLLPPMYLSIEGIPVIIRFKTLHPPIINIKNNL